MKSKMNQIPDIHTVIRLNLSQLYVTLLAMRETEGKKKKKRKHHEISDNCPNLSLGPNYATSLINA